MPIALQLSLVVLLLTAGYLLYKKIDDLEDTLTALFIYIVRTNPDKAENELAELQRIFSEADEEGE